MTAECASLESKQTEEHIKFVEDMTTLLAHLETNKTREQITCAEENAWLCRQYEQEIVSLRTQLKTLELRNKLIANALSESIRPSSLPLGNTVPAAVTTLMAALGEDTHRDKIDHFPNLVMRYYEYPNTADITSLRGHVGMANNGVYRPKNSHLSSCPFLERYRDSSVDNQ